MVAVPAAFLVSSAAAGVGAAGRRWSRSLPSPNSLQGTPVSGKTTATLAMSAGTKAGPETFRARL